MANPPSGGITGQIMKASISVLVTAAVLAIGASAHATQFVVNGDFTQLSHGVGKIDSGTTVTGWDNPAAGGQTHAYNFVMASATTGAGGVALWDAANGGDNTWNGKAAGAGNFAAMDGAYQTGPIEQTLTGLTVGASYVLSFNYAFAQQKGYNGATVQHLTETLGGQTFTSADTDLPSHGFSGWQSFTTTIVAKSATETLSFLAYGNKPVPPFALVSNVSLTGGVPEPATWAMMILGIGGIGAMARRRRAASVAEAVA